MAFTIDFSPSMETAVKEASRKLSVKEKSKIAKWNTRKSGRLIRKAAEIMADKGRAIGSLEEHDGSLCLRGAVNYAWCGNARITDGYRILLGQRNPEPILAMNHFREFLAKNAVVFSRSFTVESWNDRTKDTDEVIRWMHKFADEVAPKK